MFKFFKKKEETYEDREEVYKALYEFQLKGFESVKSLHAKHDDKAMKYLTIISIVFTVLGLFVKQNLSVNKSDIGFLYFAIIFLASTLFILLCLAARNLFYVIKVNFVERLENNEQMIDFFVKNDPSTIYYNLSKDLARAIKSYENSNTIKVHHLDRAFFQIKWGGLVFIITIILVFVKTLFE